MQYGDAAFFLGYGGASQCAVFAVEVHARFPHMAGRSAGAVGRVPLAAILGVVVPPYVIIR